MVSRFISDFTVRSTAHLGAVALVHISATAVAAVVGAGCVVVFVVAMAIALVRGLAARIFALTLYKRARDCGNAGMRLCVLTTCIHFTFLDWSFLSV